MNSTWKTALEKIDQASLTVYRAFADAAKPYPWLIVGATARDLICDRYGVEVVRATQDIDFAVQLPGWAEFEKVKQALLGSKDFEQGSQVQRLMFRGTLPVDLVPFGEVAGKDEQLVWPPEGNPQMSVVGYRDAYDAAHLIPVDNEALELRVATLPGLVMLKVLAWNDNPQLREKDAQDIGFIIENYLDFERWDYLHSQEDILDVDDFDTLLASARLLGREVAAICSPSTRQAVITVLDREIGKEESSKLLRVLVSSLKGLKPQDPVDLLKSLSAGLKD